MLTRMICCVLFIWPTARSMAANILLTDDLVIDSSTPDFGGRDFDRVVIDSGARVRVVADNEVLRKYSWQIADGTFQYEAGEGLRMTNNAQDDPVNAFVMTGGQVKQFNGNGTFLGGRTELISGGEHLVIGGDASVGGIGQTIGGFLEIRDSATIRSGIQTNRRVQMSGGEVGFVRMTATTGDVGSAVGVLELSGGTVNGPLGAYGGASIHILGEDLAVNDIYIVGTLDDGSPINATFAGGPLFLDNAPHVPGDINDDDVVDTFDLNTVRNHFGRTGVMGDADRDGVVGLGDLNLVRNHFGTGVPSHVPEPACGTLAAVCCGFLAVPLVRSGKRVNAAVP